MEDLLGIMEILRSPEGCPWDREQTHKSIRNNLLEEAYEAVEAIDTDDAELLREELGDVLLQVVFHSRLQEEAGGFGFAEVVDGIAKKLIVRHPHVFGDSTVKDSAEVLVNWEAIKRRTKGRETDTQVLKGVSAALPALMRTQKVLGKAAKATGRQGICPLRSCGCRRARGSSPERPAPAGKSKWRSWGICCFPSRRSRV